MHLNLHVNKFESATWLIFVIYKPHTQVKTEVPIHHAMGMNSQGKRPGPSFMHSKTVVPRSPDAAKIKKL